MVSNQLKKKIENMIDEVVHDIFNYYKRFDNKIDVNILTDEYNYTTIESKVLCKLDDDEYSNTFSISFTNDVNDIIIRKSLEECLSNYSELYVED